MTSTREKWRAIVERQRVFAAPMCGISDAPFRAVCREFGGPLAYTQMVAADGVVRGDAKTIDILDRREGEGALAMQLFGCDPEKLAASAARLAELGPEVVDLNMGCPARKVTAGRGGAALLREPELCRKIFRAMRAALKIPYTVKMRWDWNDDSGASLEIARAAEEEGADGLCLHARTREEGYSGRADWTRIARLKETVSIPVLGNGDVRSAEDALEMMRSTGCDGVMIGRGAIGDPWLLARATKAVAEGAPPGPEEAPDWDERARVMLRHARMMAEAKGEKHGLTLFRKHAAAYVRGLRGARILRAEMMKISDLDALARALATIDPSAAFDEEDQGAPAAQVS